MDSELEKYKDDLAKQQLIVNQSFTCENDLRKVLDKAKQVCTTLIFNTVSMTYLSCRKHSRKIRRFKEHLKKNMCSQNAFTRSVFAVLPFPGKALTDTGVARKCGSP